MVTDFGLAKYVDKESQKTACGTPGYVGKLIYFITALTLWCIMSQNGPTHFKNRAANAARFLRCV